jgi:hypothetical protein
MNGTGALLAVLAVCCMLAAMVQLAELKRVALVGMACGLALGLLLAGELASRTSMAEVSAWASHPQRRLDLSAVLLGEALLFGSQAIAIAQGATGFWWRLLGAVPAPSLLLTLFFAQVAVMLSIDGVNYDVLSWCCAIGLPLLFGLGVWLLRGVLPDIVMRSGLRLVLYGMQAGAGLWLARPPAPAVPDPLAPLGRPGWIAVAVVVGLIFVGWALQRRPMGEK